MELGSQKGTYALIFQVKQQFTCKVGKLGNFAGSPGSYVYVGSAFGPGGIQARIIHHLKLSPKPHWHLDYIRPYIQPVALCFSDASVRLEHQWASEISNMPGSQCHMHNFGSSDCTCLTHLFYFQQMRVQDMLRRKLKSNGSHAAQLSCMNLTKDNIERICG